MKTIPDRETQDRPGRSGWVLALGAAIALLLVGFVFVMMRGSGQPEAASPDLVSGPAQSSVPSPTPGEASMQSSIPSLTAEEETSLLSVIPSPTVEEPPTAVLDTPTPTGPLAPDFTLPDLDGTMRSLSQFRGRSVVLFFWATW